MLTRRCSKVSESDGDAHVLNADIANQRQMEEAVSELARRCNELDVVVANAGINGAWAPIDDLTLEEWNRTISTDLTGTFLTIRATVPLLKAAGGGSIIVVSSINGTEPSRRPARRPTPPPRRVRLRWCSNWRSNARHHIRINAVCRRDRNEYRLEHCLRQGIKQ